jgi:hypothetical protein
LKDDKGLYQKGIHRKNDRLGFEHHTKKTKILYFSTMQSPQNNHKKNWNSDGKNWKWQTCVNNERGTIGVEYLNLTTLPWHHTIGLTPKQFPNKANE